jgi:hypothetical protein
MPVVPVRLRLPYPLKEGDEPPALRASNHNKSDVRRSCRNLLAAAADRHVPSRSLTKIAASPVLLEVAVQYRTTNLNNR